MKEEYVRSISFFTFKKGPKNSGLFSVGQLKFFVNSLFRQPNRIEHDTVWSRIYGFHRIFRNGFFGLCLTYIFTFRFFIEFLKENQEDFENSMMFNMGQWLSVPFIIIGVYFMFFYDKKKKKIA